MAPNESTTTAVRKSKRVAARIVSAANPDVPMAVAHLLNDDGTPVDQPVDQPVMNSTVSLAITHRPKTGGKQLPTQLNRNRMDSIRLKNMAIKEGNLTELSRLTNLKPNNNDSPAKSTRTSMTGGSFKSSIEIENLKGQAVATNAKKKAAAKGKAGKSTKAPLKKDGSFKSTNSKSSKGTATTDVSTDSKTPSTLAGSTKSVGSSKTPSSKKKSSYDLDSPYFPGNADDEREGHKPRKQSKANNKSKYGNYIEEEDSEQSRARTTFHGNFHERASMNAINQTSTAQENHRLLDQSNYLTSELKETRTKYQKLKDDYDNLDSDYEHNNRKYKEKTAAMEDQLKRLTVALALTGKTAKGEISSDTASVVRKLVLEKLWWGVKFVETEEDLIDDTDTIANELGIADGAERAAWINAYSGVVLNAYNKERQYANNGCFEAAKSKLCAITKILCAMYTNFLC
jgi:hypothetical protein